MKPRKLAFDLLQKLEKNRQFSNIALDRALLSYDDMSAADKGLAAALLYGVTERRITLDYQISRRTERQLKDIDLPALTAIRMGLYQLIYMDRIPPHAAINESVELCSKKSSGFVNAILRSYTRNPSLLLPEKNGDIAEYLSVKHSVGLPLVRKFISVFGETRADSILASFNKPAKTTVSVNTLKISRDGLSKKIEGSTPTEFSKNGLHVKGSVRELFGFDSGLFFVQDEASQICVRALGAENGMTVIDVCSAPGSKSFGAAMTMEGKGRILSFDLHENKLSLIRDSAKRLGIDIIETAARDGRNFDPDLAECADRVICDVPCSGYGVMGKKPEIRFKPTTESAALPEIQYAILENACRYLKRGGSMIYSTCTLLPEENQLNVKRFLDSHPEFVSEPFSVGDIHAEGGMLTLTPDSHGTDGFFVAKLKKN